MSTTIPISTKLDLKALQEKATEYAMKGAIDEIKAYYTGYNSPFKEKIREELKNKSTNINFNLPDIIGLINESLKAEISKIANNSVAQSFVPMVVNLLTKAKKEMKFSEILNEFLKQYYGEDKPRCTISKDPRFGWLDIKIVAQDKSYRFCLHKDHEEKDKYDIHSLPETNSGMSSIQRMHLKNNNVTLELPFMPNTLQDKFIAFIAQVIICKSKIEMDCMDFTEEMLEKFNDNEDEDEELDY